jgi:hypothetical protein
MKKVDFETTKKLFDLGFTIRTSEIMGFYIIDNDVVYHYSNVGQTLTDYLKDPAREKIPAPTTDQVINWLREKHFIEVLVFPYSSVRYKDVYRADYTVKLLGDTWSAHLTNDDKNYQNYEEAQIAAINWIIENSGWVIKNKTID